MRTPASIRCELFRMAELFAHRVTEIDSMTRSTGANPIYGRPTYSSREGVSRRDENFVLAERLHPSLPLVVIELVNPVVAEQIESKAKLIDISPAPSRSAPQLYAASLAIIASGSSSFVRGYYKDREMWSSPDDLPQTVYTRGMSSRGPTLLDEEVLAVSSHDQRQESPMLTNGL